MDFHEVRVVGQGFFGGVDDQEGLFNQLSNQPENDLTKGSKPRPNQLTDGCKRCFVLHTVAVGHNQGFWIHLSPGAIGVVMKKYRDTLPQRHLTQGHLTQRHLTTHMDQSDIPCEIGFATDGRLEKAASQSSWTYTESQARPVFVPSL